MDNQESNDNAARPGARRSSQSPGSAFFRTYDGDPYPPQRGFAEMVRREWLHSQGRLLWLRYLIGRVVERVWGYPADGVVGRVATRLRLSGYPPND